MQIESEAVEQNASPVPTPQAAADSTLKHVDYFANTLGPRGSATDGEKKAHEYCKQVLDGLGYETHWEEFASPTSAWHPFALALGLLLLATALFYLAGRKPDAEPFALNAQPIALAAAVLGGLAAASFFLQIAHKDNPLRWLLPTAKSQNVWAAAKPAGEVKRRIVAVGHVDTHRAALAMQSPRLWQLFQLLTVALGILNLALPALFIYGIFTPETGIRDITLYLGIVLVVGLIFTVQPDLQPYVKGGNDNATGAAAVLALAERLKAEPLANTEVILLNTGSEEVGSYGVVDWINRHAPEAPDADYLVLDSIGGKGAKLNYEVDETVLTPVQADGRLVNIAESVAKENPALNAKPFHFRGLYSELSLCVAHGQKALALVAFDPHTGVPPRFHTAEDDFNNVDPALLKKSEQFVWAVMQKIDRSG